MYLERNLSQCHFVCHKLQMNCLHGTKSMSFPPTAAKLQFSYCHQHFKQMIITHWQNQHRDANEEQATPTKRVLSSLFSDSLHTCHMLLFYFFCMGMKLGLSHYGKDINNVREYGTAEEIWAQGGRVRTTEKNA